VKEGEKRKVSMYLSENRSAIYQERKYARMIWEGDKKLIVSHLWKEKVEGKRFYLVDDNLCYGVLKMGDVYEIKSDQFVNLKSWHKMDLKETWKGKKILFAYNFELEEKFETPKEIVLTSPIEGKLVLDDIQFVGKKVQSEGLVPFGEVKLVEPLVRFDSVDETVRFMFGGINGVK